MPGDRDILVRLIVKKERQRSITSLSATADRLSALTCAVQKAEAGYRFHRARPGKAVLFELTDADIQAADGKTWQKRHGEMCKEQVETGSNTRKRGDAGNTWREFWWRAVCKLAGK